MPDKIIEYCPLCHSPAIPFYKDSFFECSECKAIFLAPELFPNPIDEKARYEEHINDVNDPHYQEFVSPITSKVCEDYGIDSVGLDFGSGTGAVISKVLEDRGYTIYQYDPFFNNIPELLKKKYDYIVCCEVIEHFHDPEKEFHLLKNLLKPGGHLYCMTSIYNEDINFHGWNYKNDQTHVFIFQKETLEWIKVHYGFSSMTIDNRLVVFQKP